MIAPKVPAPTKAQESAAYADVTARDAGKCVSCGSNVGVQRDHRRNRSQGGLTEPQNLQLLCAACHLWKTDHPEGAVFTGLAVPMSAYKPSAYPARRLVFGEKRWVIYGPSQDFAVIGEAEAMTRRKTLGIDG